MITQTKLSRVLKTPGLTSSLRAAGSTVPAGLQDYLARMRASIYLSVRADTTAAGELPVTVDLKVTDTAPGIKGATASAQVKPATLETGLVVQVPPFVNTGDRVRVSTETGEYLSRA